MWGPPDSSTAIDLKLQRKVRRLLEAEEHNRLQAALEASPTTLLASLPAPALHRPDAIKVVAERQFDSACRLSQPSTRHVKVLPWFVCSHWVDSGGIKRGGCGRATRRPASGPVTEHCRICTRPTVHVQAAHRQSRLWQKVGGETADVLLQPALGAPKSVPFWVYIPYKLTKLNKDCIRSVCTLVRKALLQRQALPCSDEDKRCGVLVDFLTTASTIATGRPHQIANVVYTYVDQYHADLTFVKFVFVGLTDNQHVRTGRDVFCKGGSQFTEAKRHFDAIDSQHMFAAFPEAPVFVRHGEPMMASRGLVSAAQARFNEATKRRATTKYLPPVKTPGGDPNIPAFNAGARRARPKTLKGSVGRSGSPTQSSSRSPSRSPARAARSASPESEGDGHPSSPQAAAGHKGGGVGGSCSAGHVEHPDWLTEQQLTDPNVFLFALEGDREKAEVRAKGDAAAATLDTDPLATDAALDALEAEAGRDVARNLGGGVVSGSTFFITQSGLS